MRTAVYSFTLLCVAYGLVEASFWAYFAIALFGGGLVALFGGVLWVEKLFTVLTIVVWLLLVIGCQRGEFRQCLANEWDIGVNDGSPQF